MLVIDGEVFNVAIVDLGRNAEFLNKSAERLGDGDLEKELLGVFVNYDLEIGMTRDAVEYARLWDKLTEPVEYHEITVPTDIGDLTYTAYLSGVSDRVVRVTNGKTYWKGLKVRFISKKPTRKP